MIICLPCLFYGEFRGMAIFPFIFIRNKALKKDKVIINHEKIHLRQQIEMLCCFFFLWYIIEYFYHLIRLKDRDKAYRSISFEKEAYNNEHDFSYLQKRSFLNFFKYLKE